MRFAGRQCAYSTHLTTLVPVAADFVCTWETQCTGRPGSSCSPPCGAWRVLWPGLPCAGTSQKSAHQVGHSGHLSSARKAASSRAPTLCRAVQLHQLLGALARQLPVDLACHPRPSPPLQRGLRGCVRFYLGGNETGEPIAIMTGNVAATQFQVRNSFVVVFFPPRRVFPHAGRLSEARSSDARPTLACPSRRRSSSPRLSIAPL